MSLHRFFSVISLFVFSFNPLISGVIKADEIRDYYSEPGLQPYNFARSDSFNEEISPFSGTLQIKHTDLVIPGNGGLDLVVNRVYTSLQDVEMPSRSVNGFGWTMHFGRVVIPKDYAADACFNDHTDTSDNPSVEWPDGGREILAYSSVIGDGTTMVTRSNARAVCLQIPGGGFLVTTQDGTRYTMNQRSNDKGETSWLTTRIEDVHGNALTIAYESQDVLFYPVSVSRGDEVLVTFSYIGSLNSLRLDTMTAQGREWRYLYEPIDNNYVFPVYQLTEVQRPDGKSWQYRYNGQEPDPDPTDGVHEEYGPGSFSLNGLTYPYGATIDYTYQSVQFDPSSARRTWAIATKELAGNDISNGAWTYTFAPRSRLLVLSDGDFHLDETTITTPENRLVYTHYGKDRVGNLYFSPFQIGLVYEQETYSLQGSLLESRRYAWRERIISTEDFYHGSDFYRSQNVSVADVDAEVITRNGREFWVDYENFDDFGHPRTVTESNSISGRSQRVTTFTYQNDLNQWILGLPLTETLNGIGTITRGYFPNGKLEEENRYGVTTGYTWHPEGDLETVRDANGNITRYSNYKCGISRQDDLPENITITRSVNDTGTVASITTTNLANNHSRINAYTYDNLNRLESINFPAGDDVSINYSQSTRTLTRGAYQQSDTFDSLGRITRISRRDSVLGHIIDTATSYDALNRVIFHSDPGDTRGTTYALDALGRVINETHFDGTNISYGYEGAYVRITDQLERTTEYLYEQYGTSFDAKTITQIVQPEDVITQIQRNRLGLVTSVLQGEVGGIGYMRTYNYDSRYFLASEINPEITAQITYGRDNVGNMITRRVGTAADTVYSYDNLHRLRTIDYPTSDDVYYTYTETHKIETANNTTSQRTYAYDDNDNLQTETIVIDGMTYRIDYGIDSLDHVTSITYPSGRTVNYAPDAYGRPTQALPYVTTASYYPSGQLQSMTYANGQVTSIALTPRLWVDTIRSAGMEIAMDLAYGYDEAGNVRSIANHLNAEPNRSFGYDGINRLTSASGSWGSNTYSYTAWGDIELGDRGSHAYSGVSLTSIDTPSTSHVDISFQHDSRGNIRNENRTNLGYGKSYIYNYDEADRLVSSDLWHNNLLSRQVAFSYDGSGYRVKKSGGDSGNKFFVYSERGEFLGEYDEAGVRSGKEYFYLNNQLVASVYDDDSDVDGLDDSWEVKHFGNLSRNGLADADGDGVLEIDEFTQNLDPNHIDTDRDGLSDRFEIDSGMNPDDSSDYALDSDGDGFSNRQEGIAGTDVFSATSFPSQSTILHSSSIVAKYLPVVGSQGDLYVIDDQRLYSLRLDGSVKWIYNVRFSGAPPVAGPNGTVYVTHDRAISLLDSQGREQWIHVITDGHDLNSSPAVEANGNFYIVLSPNGGGRYPELHAFDTEGNTRWVRTLSDVANTKAITSPAIAMDGSIYVALESGELRSYSPSGDLNWVYSGIGASTASTSALAKDGTIYIATSTQTLFAISKQGKLKWKYSSPNAYDQGGNIDPVIGRDGTIYVAIKGVSSTRILYALSPHGDLKWKFGAPYAVNSPSYTWPNVDFPASIAPDGSVYVVSGGHLYRVNELGESIGSPIIIDGQISTKSGPLVDKDGLVYVVGNTGVKFISGDHSSSQSLNWHTSGHDRARTNNFCYLGGGYYSPTQDDDNDSLMDCYEIAHAINTGTDNDAESDSDDDGLTNIEEYISGTDPNQPDTDNDGLTDSEEIYQYNSDPLLKDSDHDGLSDGYEALNGFNIANAVEAFLDSNNDGFSNRLAAWLGMDPLDGSIIPEVGTNLGLSNLGGSSVVAPNGTIFTLDRISSFLVKLRALYPNGEEKWAVDASSSQDLAIGIDGSIIVGTNPLRSLDPEDGALIWEAAPVSGSPTISFGSTIISVAIGANGNIYTPTRNNEIHVYTSTGDLVSSLSVPVGSPASEEFDPWPAISADGTLYIHSSLGSSGWLYAFNTSENSLKWKTFVGATQNSLGAASTPVISSDGAVYINVGQKLMAINPDGTKRWTSQASGTAGIAVIGVDGTIYVCTSNGNLDAFSPHGDQIWSTRISATSSNNAAYSTPAIAADGTIYAYSSNGTLAAFDASGSYKWLAPVSLGQDYGDLLIDRDGTIFSGSKIILDINNGGLAGSAWPMLGRNVERSKSQCVVGGSFFMADIDTDDDGIPDCVELLNQMDPNQVTDGFLDFDSDGLLNSEEYAASTSMRLSDTDNDGVNDREELAEVFTNPLVLDTDHDGVPDNIEMELNTNPLDAVDGILDSDLDGFSNRQEVLAGFDPGSNQSTPERGARIPSDWLEEFDGEYILGADGLIYAALWNSLIAWYPDGDQKWVYSAPDDITGSPVLSPDGKIFLKLRYDMFVVLNLDGSEAARRQYPTHSPLPMAAAVDGTLYGRIGTYDYGACCDQYLVTALDANTHNEWPDSLIGQTKPEAIVVGQDGVIYASHGSRYRDGSGLGYLYAINPDGSEKWVYTAPSDLLVKPAIGPDGTIYVANSTTRSTIGNYLRAVNPLDYSEDWTLPLSGFSKRGSIAIGPDGTIYLVRQNGSTGQVVAVTPQGDLIQTFDSPNLFSYSWQLNMSKIAVAADGTVLVYGDRLYALNPDLSIAWSNAGPFDSNILLAEDGTIYAGKYIYADNNGGLARTSWPMTDHDPQLTSNAGNTGTVNTAPVLSISSPFSGSVYSMADSVVLNAVASDAEDGNLSSAISWVSDVDGMLGTGEGLIVTLSEATHTITAHVIDSGGESQAGTVNVTVYDPAIDSDADGMPDGWEAFYGISDPADDGDGDGVGNLREYQIGANPTSGDLVNGDINADNNVDARDVLLLQRHLLGALILNAQDSARADMYPVIAGDGSLTASDLLLLQKQIMGGAQ